MMMFRLAKGLFPFFLYLALQILAYKLLFLKDDSLLSLFAPHYQL